MWWDWLATSERLVSVLHEQTAALTLRQVERIERLQPDLDHLMDRLTEIDELAVALAKELAEEMGCEANLRSLVSVLEKADAQRVQALANRVIVAGRNIQTIIAKNKALIENELDYVNGTVALVARESNEQNKEYVGQQKQANVLMNHVA